jgi:antitoxin VapB
MALELHDERLDALAEQAQRILKAPTKADAIRQALQRVVGAEPLVNKRDAAMPEKPVEERLKVLQDRVRKLGTPNPDFDDKAFLDEMWGM